MLHLHRRRAFLITMGLLAALVTICCGSGISLAQRSPLVKGAMQIAGFQDWDFDGNPICAWLTDDKVLFWRRTPAEDLLYEHNVRTRQETQMRQCSTHADRGPATPVASPDGKWLFWIDSDDRNDYLLTMPRRREIRLPTSVTSHLFGFDLVYWMPDSRHWLMLDRVTDTGKFQASEFKRMLIGDVRSPGHVRRLSISPHSPLRHYGEPNAETIRILSPHRMLLIESGDDHKGSVSIYELHLDAHALPVRHFTALLPTHAHVEQVACSPGGDKIAWMFSFSTGGHSHDWEVWLSRSDARQMHRFIALTGRADDHPILYEDLQWLPDGRRISFVYKGSLWVVPVTTSATAN